MTAARVEPRASSIAAIRRIVLTALLLGLIGTGVELLLLEHFEDWRQMAPLTLIGSALIVLLWHAVDRRAAPVRVLQGLMAAFAVSGVAGVLLHYRSNVEFELEMYPSLSGLELFKKSMMGATPALAPGTMILLGLVGLAYAYRHPRGRRREETRDPGGTA